MSTAWQAPEPQAGPAPGLEFGGPGARLVAYIVDSIVQFGLSVLLFIIGVALLVIFAPLGLAALLAGGLFLFLYFPYFWQKSGQTPGMRMMGIKVVRDADGGPIGWGAAILRFIGYWVSTVVFYLGFIWIFIDKRQRGWHDLIGGTVVIKADQRPVAAPPPAVTAPPPPAATIAPPAAPGGDAGPGDVS